MSIYNYIPLLIIFKECPLMLWCAAILYVLINSWCITMCSCFPFVISLINYVFLNVNLFDMWVVIFDTVMILSVLLLVMRVILQELTDVWMVLMYLCPFVYCGYCSYFLCFCLPLFFKHLCCFHLNSLLYPNLSGFLLTRLDFVIALHAMCPVYLSLLSGIIFGTYHCILAVLLLLAMA